MKIITNGKRAKRLAALFCSSLLLMFFGAACGQADKGLAEIEEEVRLYADAVMNGEYGEAWDMVFSNAQSDFLSREVFIASYENAGAEITSREISVLHAPADESASGSSSISEEAASDASEELYRISVSFFTEDGSRVANDYIELDVPKADVDAGEWELQPHMATVMDVVIEAPAGAAVTFSGVNVEAKEGDDSSYVVPETFKGAHIITVQAPGYLEYKKVINITDDGQVVNPVFHLDGGALLQMQQDLETVLSGIYGQIDGKEIPEDCLAFFTTPALAGQFDLSMYEDRDFSKTSNARVHDVTIMPADYRYNVGEYAVDADFKLTHTETLELSETEIKEIEEMLSYEFLFVEKDGQWLIDAVYAI